MMPLGSTSCIPGADLAARCTTTAGQHCALWCVMSCCRMKITCSAVLCEGLETVLQHVQEHQAASYLWQQTFIGLHRHLVWTDQEQLLVVRAAWEQERHGTDDVVVLNMVSGGPQPSAQHNGEPKCKVSAH